MNNNSTISQSSNCFVDCSHKQEVFFKRTGFDGSDCEEDTGGDNRGTEIKEQMYQEKLNNIKQQMQKLRQGTLPELKVKMFHLEKKYKEKLKLIFQLHSQSCTNVSVGFLVADDRLSNTKVYRLLRV